MQAIRTRFYGASSTTGSCIRATCDAGSIRVSYNHSLDPRENHTAACSALMDRLGWLNDGLESTASGEFGGDIYHIITRKV